MIPDTSAQDRAITRTGLSAAAWARKGLLIGGAALLLALLIWTLTQWFGGARSLQQ
jgi:hypothetical protein